MRCQMQIAGWVLENRKAPRAESCMTAAPAFTGSRCLYAFRSTLVGHASLGCHLSKPSQERGMRYAFEDGRGAMKDDEIGACCRIVWSTYNEADGKTHMRQSVSS